MDKLQHDTLRPACLLKGFVKKTDSETEILFKPKEPKGSWIKLPVSVISSAVVLKRISCGEETNTLVKLHLKMPSTLEGKALYELLTAFSAGEKARGSGCHCCKSGCRCRMGLYPHEQCQGHDNWHAGPERKSCKNTFENNTDTGW
ncbi:MAG: hypothetical protein ACXVPQ_04890 [Bacteroidia bacterium]